MTVWNTTSTIELLNALVAYKAAHANKNMRAAEWEIIMRSIEGNFTRKQCVSRLQQLRILYVTLQDLLRMPGAEFDHTQGRVILDNSVWEKIKQSNPAAYRYRDKHIPYYKQLDDIFRGRVGDKTSLSRGDSVSSIQIDSTAYSVVSSTSNASINNSNDNPPGQHIVHSTYKAGHNLFASKYNLLKGDFRKDSRYSLANIAVYVSPSEKDVANPFDDSQEIVDSQEIGDAQEIVDSSLESIANPTSAMVVETPPQSIAQPTATVNPSPNPNFVVNPTAKTVVNSPPQSISQPTVRANPSPIPNSIVNPPTQTIVNSSQTTIINPAANTVINSPPKPVVNPTTNTRTIPASNSRTSPASNSRTIPASNTSSIPTSNSRTMTASNSRTIPASNSSTMPASNAIRPANSVVSPTTNSVVVPTTNSNSNRTINSNAFPVVNSTTNVATNSIVSPTTKSKRSYKSRTNHNSDTVLIATPIASISQNQSASTIHNNDLSPENVQSNVNPTTNVSSQTGLTRREDMLFQYLHRLNGVIKLLMEKTYPQATDDNKKLKQIFECGLKCGLSRMDSVELCAELLENKYLREALLFTGDDTLLTEWIHTRRRKPNA